MPAARTIVISDSLDSCVLNFFIGKRLTKTRPATRNYLRRYEHSILGYPGQKPLELRGMFGQFYNSAPRKDPLTNDGSGNGCGKKSLAFLQIEVQTQSAGLEIHSHNPRVANDA